MRYLWWGLPLVLLAGVVFWVTRGSPGQKGDAGKVDPSPEKPSPLDRLDRSKIPAEVLTPEHPPEVVAVLLGHHRAASAVAFSPDGALIASGSWDNTTRLWKLGGPQPEEWANLKGSPSGLAFAPDGKTLAAGTPGTPVVLWDVAGTEPRVKHTLAGHRNRPFALAFAPTGRWLASGCFNPLLQVWKLGEEPEAWAILEEEKNPNLGIASLAFSGDGTLLAAGSFTGNASLRVWKLGDFLEELEIPPAQARLVAFSPDNQLLAYHGDGGPIHLWDRSGDGFRVRGKLPGHPLGGGANVVRALAFAPEGRLLASSGQDRKVVLWDPRPGKKVREWDLPGEAKALAFAPDGRHLATANEDGTVYLLRLSSKE